MLKKTLKTLNGESIDWKRLLKIEHEPTFGLDIGSSSVKLLQLQKNGNGYGVAAAAIVDVSADGGIDKMEAEANTINAIRQCLAASGIESRSAVCGVCGPEVAVRDFSFPVLPLEEVEGAVALEAGQACPLQISESTVDYHLLSDGPEIMSGVLVAATHKVIRDKVHFAQSAEVKSVLMDVDGLAILNCFTETVGRMPGQTVAILNVGGSCATLAILGDDNCPCVRDILHAGSRIIAEIASDKDFPKDKVREILCMHGFDGEQLDEAIVQKACRGLAADVADTLRYYTAQQKAAFIDKIYVCGGFALVNGFVEFLGTQLPARPVLWNPFDRISCPAAQCKDIVARHGPAFAVAVGLAMRKI